MLLDMRRHQVRMAILFFFSRSFGILLGIMFVIHSGCLLKQLNHSVIFLIPKSSHSSTVGDYKPIVCYNVVYKVISKILTGRMTTILPVIIDDA